ncbi:MAG: formyltetrahydrofolate deformylase [Salinispira sp.]
MKTHSSAVLLFSCPDRKGIVAAISGFIHQHNGNIIDSSQYYDDESGTFFMRMEWDLNNFDLSEHDLTENFRPLADRFTMDWYLHFSNNVQRIAIFVSRELYCLYDLLLRHREGEIPAEVAAVVSNHPTAADTAQWFGVPFYHIPVSPATRQTAEREQIERLSQLGVDTVILARYMQILSTQFIHSFPNRIINIHHSFLPAFIGARPYHQAYKRGVKIIGATSHYATADLDEGPIIEQDVTRISHRDSVTDIMRAGRNLERAVLERAVMLHLQHRVLVFQNKTVIFH